MKSCKDEDDDVKDEPGVDQVKKDEMDSDDDGEQESGPNQEDSDIREMKYRLEKLIQCFQHYIFLEFSISSQTVVPSPFCPNTCPSPPKSPRKDLSLNERQLVIRNITWVFDKVCWLLFPSF